MSKEKIEDVIGVIESWERWFDWNEAQRVVLKDVLFHLKQAERVKKIQDRDKRIIELEKAYIKQSNRVRWLEMKNISYRALLNSICSDCDMDNVLDVIDEYEALEGETDE